MPDDAAFDALRSSSAVALMMHGSATRVVAMLM